MEWSPQDTISSQISSEECEDPTEAAGVHKSINPD